jgi:twinkle protein
MSLAQLGVFNSVSVPGGAENLAWIESEWDWLNRFDTIFLAFDINRAGEHGAVKAAKRLGSWRCLTSGTP